MLEKLKLLFDPLFWCYDVGYVCEIQDKYIRHLIEIDGVVSKQQGTVTSIYGDEIWIYDYPYAYGKPWSFSEETLRMPLSERALPSRAARKKFKEYIERKFK